MSLSVSSTASALTSGFETAPIGGFLAVMNKVIDDGLQAGSMSEVSVDISTVAGSLNIKDTDGIVLPSDIGNAVASYWSKAITPGTPISCDAVSAVSNDASKIAGPIASDLTTFCEREGVQLPQYSDLIDIIFKHTKTIVWTVEESDSDCSTSYPVNIS